MTTIPGSISTESQPPMTIPLRHFLVGLGFLLVGVGTALWTLLSTPEGFTHLAMVHLLLVGFVCVTIMGAMTQFVPVWSGVALHSRRLANLQLALVAGGLCGVAAALVGPALAWLPVFGLVLFAGLWTFVYNLGRTMWTVEDADVTERHFQLALSFVLFVTVLGVTLAVNLTRPLLTGTPVTHLGVRQAHVTVAVFGVVLTTIYGALYQLGTMFTQTELDGFDRPLQAVECVAHPAGVVLLAGGHLFAVPAVARVGGLCVVAGALAIATVLGRKLYTMRVDWTPMHTRYALAVPTLGLWAASTAQVWLLDPLAPANLFGGTWLLLAAWIGFVVAGTLYHVVPFILWVHRYSDRVGFESVPMVDDLYDDRLAAIDAALLVAGTVVLAGTTLLGLSATVRQAGGLVLALGGVVFAANMLLVVRRHSPHPFGRLLLGRRGHRSGETD